MRILFASGALLGHVNTLLPLALAAAQAGHEVRFATGPDYREAVERHGLPALAVGLTHAQAGGNRQASWLTYFEATADGRAADLLREARDWRPDVVVHEETELAGSLAAASVGTVHVVHGLGVMPPARVWQALLEATGRLGARWQVPDAPRSLERATYLHLCPPSLHSAETPGWRRILPIRPVPGRAPSDALPGYDVAALPYARTIHLTLGSVYNGNTDVLRVAIEALATVEANLVVTVGADGDPSRHGPQPAHIRIERYVPHERLLPHCDLVVSHAGAGTLFGGLAHGLPQLLLPQGADQFLNAAAAAASGAALALTGDDVTAASIRGAVRRLLDDPRFGQAARRVRAEIEAMPAAAEVVAQLATTSAR